MSNFRRSIQHGSLEDIICQVEQMDEKSLEENVASRREGIFHYSSLHEAVACGRHEVLDYLLTKTRDAFVNLKDNSGYTLLHLAACSGQTMCARTLLSHGASVIAKDGFNKTPAQTAELCCHMSILRLLKKEELLRKIEINSESVPELLRGSSVFMDDDYLSKYLVAATRNNNQLTIAKLIIKGARNIDECLELAHTQTSTKAKAVLLLCKAGINGIRNLVLDLFSSSPGCFKHSYESFVNLNVRKAVMNKQVSLMAPMELARSNGHFDVREELLLMIDVDESNGCVGWHKLYLMNIEISWLRKITWVQVLRLDKNSLTSLPPSIGHYLKQVRSLSLKSNKLDSIPASIFEIPALYDLCLQNNSLSELPEVHTWPSSLKTLDLSYNRLQSLPEGVVAERLTSLNLSNNQFRFVPSCITGFHHLHSLYLDNNPKIMSLPKEMGNLKCLSKLSLHNLKHLVCPPKSLHLDCKSSLAYLRNLSTKTKPLHSTNVMVVGPCGKGKTSFVNYLTNKKGGEEKTTSEVDVCSWSHSSSSLKMKFQFRIWDFRGSDAYFSTQQILFFPNSLYFVVFNLSDGDAGIQELRLWLNYISLIVPHSNVVVIGTHLDQIPKEERDSVDVLFKQILSLAELYDKIHVIDMIAVGLENDTEYGEWLRNTVCKCAKYQSFNLNAEDIPPVYNKLYVQLKLLEQSSVKGQRSPFMHMEELKSMVLSTNTRDIHDEKFLKALIQYLSNAGIFVHFADSSSLLKNLLFIDFQWLCVLITSTISCRKLINMTPNDGIFGLKNVLTHFKSVCALQWDCSREYVTLLENFEIALLLDDAHIFIPSLLPSVVPKAMREMTQPPIAIHRRSVVFKTGLPSAFWSFLLFRIFQSISLVRDAVVSRLQSADNQTSEDCPSILDNSGRNSNLSKHLPERNTHPKFLPGDFEGAPTADNNFCMNSVSDTCAASQNNQPTVYGQSEHVSCESKSSDIVLVYWKTGICYQSTSVMFQAMAEFHKNGTEEIQISYSVNDQGREVGTQIVDLIYSIIKKWYPGLAEDCDSPQQNVVCPKCITSKQTEPCEFCFDQCLMNRLENVKDMKCNGNGPNSHAISLRDIVPEVYLTDYSHEVLEFSDIHDQEDGSLISKGKYGTVFKGTYKTNPVVVEKYNTCCAPSFYDLHEKVRQLSKLQHPFLVSIVGISINPLAIIVERSPLGSLSALLLEKHSIPKITQFRIAAEIAAALRFLHSNGIVLGNFTPHNVAVWGVDPTSPCHCKLISPFTAPYTLDSDKDPVYYKRSFTAPEVLEIGKEKQSLWYKHILQYDWAADSYSYGMFFYQILTCSYPYHYSHAHVIDVINGARPKLDGVATFTGGYNYLSMLLKRCREVNPKKRPDMNGIIGLITSVEVQSLVGVCPLSGKCLPSYAAGSVFRDPEEFPGKDIILQDDLWLFFNSEDEGPHIRILNSHTMSQVMRKTVPQTTTIECVLLHQNLVCTGAFNQQTNTSRIDMYSTLYRSCLYSHSLDKTRVTCIAGTRENILIGTQEGLVYLFACDVVSLKEENYPQIIHTCPHHITALVSTPTSVWVLYANIIDSYDLSNFSQTGSVNLKLKEKMAISKLSYIEEQECVWSTCFGGSDLTAWNAKSFELILNIDCSKILHDISVDVKAESFVITAMTTALNTTWVGMKTGHILVFGCQDLITWYHPFKESVSVLSTIPVTRADSLEQLRVVSCGCSVSEHMEQADYSGIGKSWSENILAIWDVYDAATLTQMKLIEKHSPELFDSYQIMEQVMHRNDKCLSSKNFQTSERISE